MVDGLLILLLFQFLGELVIHFTGLPLPAPVVGMVNLRHVIVAAYSDYLTRDTDLPLPAEVEAPAEAQ